MEIDNIKDVLGRIMTINKNLNETTLRNLLSAANWDIDDIDQAIDVFKYYNNEEVNKEKIEKSNFEIYANLKDKSDENKMKELENIKKQIEANQIEKELEDYQSNFITNILNNQHFNKLKEEISKLRNELNVWKLTPDYRSGTSKELILNKKIDFLTEQINKCQKAIEEEMKAKSESYKKAKEAEAKEKENTIAANNDHIEKQSIIYNKEGDKGVEVTHPVASVEGIDKYNYSTLLLSFLNAFLIVIIFIILIYILIN